MWEISSLLLLSRFFISQKYEYISWCRSFKIHLTRSVLSFLDAYTWVFIKFRRFSTIISSNILSALFLSLLLLKFPQCICWSTWWCSIDLIGSVHFSSIFFCYSDSIISIFLISKFTDPIFCLLKSVFEILYCIFHFSYNIFNSRISFWFLLSLHWHFHFIHSLFLWLSPHFLLIIWASITQSF